MTGRSEHLYVSCGHDAPYTSLWLAEDKQVYCSRYCARRHGIPGKLRALSEDALSAGNDIHVSDGNAATQAVHNSGSEDRSRTSNKNLLDPEDDLSAPDPFESAEQAYRIGIVKGAEAERTRIAAWLDALDDTSLQFIGDHDDGIDPSKLAAAIRQGERQTRGGNDA